jgi:hypothetical protein
MNQSAVDRFVVGDAGALASTSLGGVVRELVQLRVWLVDRDDHVVVLDPTGIDETTGVTEPLVACCERVVVGVDLKAVDHAVRLGPNDPARVSPCRFPDCY